MSKFNVALFIFMVGVAMAMGSDVVGVSDGGLVISGIGLGMMRQAVEDAQ